MYGKKKMMGGGKMPKPMMKKGGKMSALVIMAKPAKKAEAGAEMMGPEKPMKKIKKAVKKMGKSAAKGAVKGAVAGSMIGAKLMKKGGSMMKSKAPKTFAPKSPKMAKGGKMKSC